MKKQLCPPLLAVAAALAALSLFVLSLTAESEQSELFLTQQQAYLRMQRCMEAVRGYKVQQAIPMPDYDVCRTGMLGEEFNMITTTLGSLEAKRTTADPNMAALLVRMLHDAGVKQGDSVCALFSGSFPSLNIAVLAACDAMGAKVFYISSVGASTYGANNIALTFPDMAHRLYSDGLILSDSVMVTAGGDWDVGIGMDEQALLKIKQRISGAGLFWFEQPELAANIRAKKELLDSFAPDCFVSVGGNLSSLGSNRRFDNAGQGLLRPMIGLRLTDDKSGLIERYLFEGLPVLHLLNIKQLAAEYGLPFDPMRIAPVGESAIFFRLKYRRPLIALSFAAVCLPVGLYGLKRRKEREEAKRQSEAQLFCTALKRTE